MAGGQTVASSGFVTGPRGPRSHVRIWNAATGRELRTLTFPNRSHTKAVAFSPDGKWLATMNWGWAETSDTPVHDVAILDPATGTELATFNDDFAFGRGF